MYRFVCGASQSVALSPSRSLVSIPPPSSMFYQLSQKLSKGSMMAITIPTIIAASYSAFAFFRYTGPDLGGALPGSPKTTSAEWQAASVEYGKAQKANPIRHFKD
uniref:Uncharacterized protein n=1 Tax=Peronospora matthiolae TaxID=2874970 RepID=A0AAV1VHA8_9STRA